MFEIAKKMSFNIFILCTYYGYMEGGKILLYVGTKA